MDTLVEVSYKNEMCLRFCKKNRHDEYEVLAKITSRRKISRLLSELKLHEIKSVSISPKHNQVSLLTDEGKIILKDYSKLKKDQVLITTPPVRSIIEYINREFIRINQRNKSKFQLVISNLITPKTTITAALLLSISIGTISHIQGSQKIEFVDTSSITYEVNTTTPTISDSINQIIVDEENKILMNPNTGISPVEINKNEHIDKIATIFDMNYEQTESIVKNMEIPEPVIPTKDKAWLVSSIDLLDTLNNGTTLNYNRNELLKTLAIQKYYVNDYTIDKTPQLSNRTEEEKEQYIIDIAKNIYGVVDDNLLETMIMSRRLETGHGTSSRCLNDNNQGGVKVGGGDFAIYKTFEIGAESFVRNFLVIYARSLVMETYTSTNTIAETMGNQYCTEETEHWIRTVNELKETESMPVFTENNTKLR